MNVYNKHNIKFYKLFKYLNRVPVDTLNPVQRALFGSIHTGHQLLGSLVPKQFPGKNKILR